MVLSAHNAASVSLSVASLCSSCSSIAGR